MRDFFIRSLDLLVGIVVVLLIIGTVLAAVVALIGAGEPGTPLGGGIAAAVGILIAGTVYTIFVGGFLYLGLGIYHNTRRAAEAVERMAAGGAVPPPADLPPR